MLSETLEKLSSRKLTVIMILLLCLGLRIGAAYYKGDAEITDKDARIWMEIADNLNAGYGFARGKYSYDRALTAYSEPGYPAFLAAIYRTVGDGLLDIYNVQAVLDTLTCFLVIMLAVRAARGRRLPGILAGLAFALYPPFILSTCTPMTETLGTFMVTVAVFATYLSVERGARFAAVAGALGGAAMLVRSPMTFFPLAVAVVFFLARKTSPHWVRKSLAYAAAAYLVLCPWVIRNYIVMDAFLIVPTRGSTAFWGATGIADGYTLTNPDYPVSNDFKNRRFYLDRKIPVVSDKTYRRITAFRQRIAGLSEVEKDRALRKDGLRAILERPGRFAFLGVKKVVRLWFNLWYDWPPSTESIAIAALNGVLILLALSAYWRRAADATFGLTAAAALIYVTVVSATTGAVVRYSYPVMPLVLILAAASAASFVTGKRRCANTTSAPQPVDSSAQ